MTPPATNDYVFLSSPELATFKEKHEPLTDDDLREIRERCDLASAGRWIARRENPDFLVIGAPVCYMDEDQDVVVGQPLDCGPTNDPLDDAQFIAHARTDVPRLLTEIERLRKELAERDARDTCNNDLRR